MFRTLSKATASHISFVSAGAFILRKSLRILSIAEIMKSNHLCKVILKYLACRPIFIYGGLFDLHEKDLFFSLSDNFPLRNDHYGIEFYCQIRFISLFTPLNVVIFLSFRIAHNT